MKEIAALKGNTPGADPDLEDAADTASEDDPSDPTVCCPKCGHEFKESESAEPETAKDISAPPVDTSGESDFGESEGGGYKFGGRA